MSELGQSLKKLRSRSAYLSKTIELPKKPIGIKTPLERGNSHSGESLFKMHFSIEDQIIDNLKNLIMTQKGERLGFSDYGTNLSKIYSDTSLSEENVANVASGEISSVVRQYMPSIRLNQFYSERIGDVSNKDNISNINGLNLADSLPDAIDIDSVSSVEVNKNNKDVDSIHKITIEFFIPSLDSKKRLLELFINSGK